MQCSRSSLHTLHALSRALPSAARAPVPSSSSSSSPLQAAGQVRHASWSLPSIRNLLPRKLQRSADDSAAADAPAAAQEATPAKKDVFDAAVEDEDVALSQARSGWVHKPSKPATFVCLSTSLSYLPAAPPASGRES